jgi:hypothetical protein
MVFWLIAMLSMVIYSMHAIVAHDVELTISQSQAFRARQLAEMGLNIAMNPNVKKYDRALLEQSGERGSIVQMLPDESFSVKIRGEGGRININALIQNEPVHRGLATNFFHLWGLTNEEADILFDCMVDWMDADDEKTTHGMERKDYLEASGQAYTSYPFNRPFYNLEEITNVPGFKKIIANLPDWRDYFTVYSAGKLDVNEAEAKVLAAAAVACGHSSNPQRELEVKLGEAQELVNDRFGADGIEDTEDDIRLNDATEMNTFLGKLLDGPEAGYPELLFGLNDQTVHIESVATVGDYRKRVVLVVRNRNANPQILAREEVPLFYRQEPNR